jgi:hypothetical protein
MIVLLFLLCSCNVVVIVAAQVEPTTINDKFLACENATIKFLHAEFFGINHCERIFHRIPNRYTAYQLGPSVMQGRWPYEFKEGPPLVSVTIPNNRLLPFATQSPNKELDIIPAMILKDMLNPSYVYYRDDLIISWRLPARFAFESSSGCRVVHIPRQHNAAVKLGFGKDVLLDLKRLKGMTNATHTLSSFPRVDIPNCEDLRLFKKSEGNDHRLLGHFARRYAVKATTPEIQTNVALFHISGNSISVSATVLVDMTHIYPSQDQKNWVHFDFNESISFMTQIIPKSIIFLPFPLNSYLKDNNDDRAVRPVAVTIDNSVKASSIGWDYGELRGGTSAIQLEHSDDGTSGGFPSGKRSVFVSIFHSSTKFSNSSEAPSTAAELSVTARYQVPRTYSMGVITFDTTPPFALHSISPIPIVHRFMYTGDWPTNNLAYDITDYIVFPMSLIVRKNMLFIFYGFQDRDGWFFKLKPPQQLLQSLKRIS